MFERDELVLNTTDKKLLFAIHQTLQEIKALLPVPATREQTAEDRAATPLEEMKRNELMALVRNLPDGVKPGRYQRFTNQELIDLLKKEGGRK
jgi:hypothetical protein